MIFFSSRMQPLEFLKLTVEVVNASRLIASVARDDDDPIFVDLDPLHLQTSGQCRPERSGYVQLPE